MLETILLSLALALLCVAVPWGTSQIRSWPIALGSGAGIALGLAGIAFSLAWYPWTDLVVLLVALTAGVLLGRVLPAKLWPFLLLLLILSIADIVQNALPGPPPPLSGSQSLRSPAALLYGNFLLFLPWGRYNIGIFDLLLLTAMAEYWRKRGSTFLLALAPGTIGFILALGFDHLTSTGSLPLIPFLSAGWLCSAGLYSSRRRPNRSQAALHRKGGGEQLKEHGQEEA